MLASYTLIVTLLNVFATFGIEPIILKYSALNKKLLLRALFCILPIYLISILIASSIFSLVFNYASFIMPSIILGASSLLINNVGIRIAQGTSNKLLYICFATAFPIITLCSFVIYTYVTNGQLLDQIYYLRAASLSTASLILIITMTFNNRYRAFLIKFMLYAHTTTAKKFINKIKRQWIYSSTIYFNAIVGSFLGQLDRLIVINFTSLSDFGFYSIIKTALSIPFSLIEAVTQSRSKKILKSNSLQLTAQIQSLAMWGLTLGLLTPFIIVFYLVFIFGLDKYDLFNISHVAYLLPCAIIIASQGFNKCFSLISLRLNLHGKLWKLLALTASTNPLIVVCLFFVGLDSFIFFGHAISQTLLILVLYFIVYKSQNFSRIGPKP